MSEPRLCANCGARHRPGENTLCPGFLESHPTWEQYLHEHDLFVVTAADKAVLDAMHAIPDGTLRSLLTPSCLSFSGSVVDALRAELARREALTDAEHNDPPEP